MIAKLDPKAKFSNSQAIQSIGYAYYSIQV